MEKAGESETGSDLNGNSSKFAQNCKKRKRQASPPVKGQIKTADGRIFYPCRYCNKVFSVKKTRADHVRDCPAKEYIFSVADEIAQEPPKFTHKAPEIKPVIKKPVLAKPQLFKKKPSDKIDIHQNIVLNKHLNVEHILSKSPIKITIRRSPSNGTNKSNHFTVSNNSLILKEKNEELDSLAKRLEGNAVNIAKTPKPPPEPNKEEKKAALESPHTDSDTNCGSTDSDTNRLSPDGDNNCRECSQEFGSQMELLRHQRDNHKFPKVVMAISEIKKFYNVKNRTKCPICRKPLKNHFRSAFVKHLHTHTNEMKYSCHVCKKNFRRVDHMKTHVKRHVVEDKK